MGRYEEAEIFNVPLQPKLKNSVKGFKTTMYRQIPKEDTDIYVITQMGDRLDLLANQFYNDPNLWWYIAQANDLFTMNLEAGTSLRIPSSTKYAELEK